MRHINASLLPPRVVAELVGLSPASLRRWDIALLPRAARRRRRYSWDEVEILQRAVHQASGRGGTPAAFQGRPRLDGARRSPTDAGRGGHTRPRRTARPRERMVRH
jgi:hypothetical protein